LHHASFLTVTLDISPELKKINRCRLLLASPKEDLELEYPVFHHSRGCRATTCSQLSIPPFRTTRGQDQDQCMDLDLHSREAINTAIPLQEERAWDQEGQVWDKMGLVWAEGD
jgi:hypothetical protein